MKPQCPGQCSGCALLPGAKANGEVDNNLTGMLCALGGIPFYCHEKMGWTPERESDGYPVAEPRLSAAIDALRSAPRLIHASPGLVATISDATPTGLPPHAFDDARALIGKAPVCGGWKAAVAELNKQGWFATNRRKVQRIMAIDGLAALNEIKKSPRNPDTRAGRKQAQRYKALRAVIDWFFRELGEFPIDPARFGL